MLIWILFTYSMIVTGIYIYMFVNHVLELREYKHELKNPSLLPLPVRVAISNTVKEAIIIANKQGVIISCNKATETLFGWLKDELIGKNISELVPPKYLEAHLKGMRNYQETGEGNVFNKTLDLEGLRKDGTVFSIGLSIMPIVVGRDIFLSAVVRDTSYRVESERQIHILNETLKTRTAALESFQFSVAHDLNAPLRSMEGFSEILVEDFGNKIDPLCKEYLLKIQSSAKRMRQLIVDMLRLSRVTQGINTLVKEQINLSDIVNVILNDHAKNYNENNRRFIFYIQPNIIAEVDKELITIALLNLLSNAWKFTGTKELTEIDFGTRIIDGKTVYYIKDNGVGFDMNKANKLFKPFSRLHDKKDFDGNGVGLAIVKQVITLHDGEVWAEGQVGQGTTFYFTIGNNKHVRTN